MDNTQLLSQLQKTSAVVATQAAVISASKDNMLSDLTSCSLPGCCQNQLSPSVLQIEKRRQDCETKTKKQISYKRKIDDDPIQMTA